MKRLLLAGALIPLAGCIPTANGWYQIGPATPPITAIDTVHIADCKDADGYPFTYEGPAESAPAGCGKTPLLQARGAK